MQEIILNERYFEKGLSKGLVKKDYQKVKFIFSFPFNGQSSQKQKGSGTSHHSPFKPQNKLRKIPLFVIYCLTKFDDVM